MSVAPTAPRVPPPPVARRLATATIVGALIVLVTCDLAVASFGRWWDRHPFTTDVASSLLVLGFAALVVDEVIARRQRRQRSVSVAIQSLIVFEQARRTYERVMGVGEGRVSAAEVRGEATSLANMLLIASPALFDDPEARVFLELAQRLAGWMFLALASPVRLREDVAPLERASAEMSGLKDRARSLAMRLPEADAVSFVASDRPPSDPSPAPSPAAGSPGRAP